jgi:hypothetical protein
MTGKAQHPVGEVRSYLAHPQLVGVVPRHLQFVLGKIFFVNCKLALLFTGHIANHRIRILDFDDIEQNIEVFTSTFIPIITSDGTYRLCHISL